MNSPFAGDENDGDADKPMAPLASWDRDILTRYAAAIDHHASKVGSDGMSESRNGTMTLSTSTSSMDRRRRPTRDSKLGFVELLDGSNKLVSIFAITTYLIKVMPRDDLTWRAKVYRDCFTGRDGVKVLRKSFKLPGDEQAVAMGRSLQRKKIIHTVYGGHAFGNNGFYFRLQPFNNPNVLNSFRVWTLALESDPMSVIAGLEKMLLEILSSVTDCENNVDFIAAGSDREYLVFEEAVCELQVIDLGYMKGDMRLAFAIRLYNLIITHAYIKVGVPLNSIQRASFYRSVCYDIGGFIFSLDDLEHGVIRANSKPPFLVKTPFEQNDPRLHLAVKGLDPRIHFAISCGKQRFGVLTCLTAEYIDEDLQTIAEAYCEDETNVSINYHENQISLAMLFYWYRSDFAKSESALPQAVLPYLQGEKKRMLRKMISRGWITVKYVPYNWGTDNLKSKPFVKGILDPKQVIMKDQEIEPKPLKKKTSSSFLSIKEKETSSRSLGSRKNNSTWYNALCKGGCGKG